MGKLRSKGQNDIPGHMLEVGSGVVPSSSSLPALVFQSKGSSSESCTDTGPVQVSAQFTLVLLTRVCAPGCTREEGALPTPPAGQSQAQVGQHLSGTEPSVGRCVSPPSIKWMEMGLKLNLLESSHLLKFMLLLSNNSLF